MFRTVAAVALILVAVESYAAKIPTGVYSAVSESEWSLEVDLKVSQKATITISTWEAGESDKAETRTYQGTWKPGQGSVVLHFKEGQATFKVEPNLSFDDFGQSGAAPGLVGTAATFEQSLLIKRPLWLQSELKKIKWP